jgi:hypothetical protein
MQSRDMEYTNTEILHQRILPLAIGGVMRCCVETLDTTLVLEKEGDILHCKYCDSSLIVRNGIWQWNH